MFQFSVVQKPWEGGEKDGVLGAFKGFGKGVFGLVVKPVKGVLDGAKNLIDGAGETFVSDDEKPRSMRNRVPRPIYMQQYCKTYDEWTAKGLFYLTKHADM